MAYKQNRRTKPQSVGRSVVQGQPESLEHHEMEKWVSWRFGLLCGLQLLQGIRSLNYEIIVDEKTLKVQCDPQDDKGNIPFNQIFDVSNLTFDMADDLETLYFNGDVRVLIDLPKGPITMQADLFRWERGQWLQTPLAQKRNDLCKALNNPLEVWRPFVIKVPKSQRKCPPNKGHIYTLSNTTNHGFVPHMPRVDIAGDLKAVIHLSTGNIKTCTTVYLTVYTS
ncbi:uncharacterized protein LOC108097874 [Drosophila ficusphila]|uniref:uncharacterized protein LOC108097874 n=1 Tax=Drosophila ficusphila TaxID=30025 RepID=UPI0007E7F6A7|nr:uncharacterized protein LOC108097874 [Drosophila ficusphila]